MVIALNYTQTFMMYGFAPRQDLPQLYSCFDVMVFSSTTPYETFGIVNIVRVWSVFVLVCG